MYNLGGERRIEKIHEVRGKEWEKSRDELGGGVKRRLSFSGRANRRGHFLVGSLGRNFTGIKNLVMSEC